MTNDEVTPDENIEKALKVEITNHPEIKEINLTSKDTQSPYDDMDISDEEIQSYMEDINAQ